MRGTRRILFGGCGDGRWWWLHDSVSVPHAMNYILDVVKVVHFMLSVFYHKNSTSERGEGMIEVMGADFLPRKDKSHRLVFCKSSHSDSPKQPSLGSEGGGKAFATLTFISLTQLSGSLHSLHLVHCKTSGLVLETEFSGRRYQHTFCHGAAAAAGPERESEVQK